MRPDDHHSLALTWGDSGVRYPPCCRYTMMQQCDVIKLGMVANSVEMHGLQMKFFNKTSSFWLSLLLLPTTWRRVFVLSSITSPSMYRNRLLTC